MKIDKKKKVVYYSDPLNDDFAGNSLKAKPLPKNFSYSRNSVIFKIFRFFIYYVVAKFILHIICFFTGVKIIGKEKIKDLKDGYFLYGNHTKWMDAFIPSVMITGARYTYIVSKTDAFDSVVSRNLLQALGMFPLPTSYEFYRPFFEELNRHVKDKKRPVTIYPEAHIWPFYTGIRPFPFSSFHYPAKLSVPVVPFFTIYRKNKGLFKLIYGKAPRMTIYIGDPIYPDQNKSIKENTNMLGEKTYEYMESIKNKYPSVEYVKYVYLKEEEK